MNRMIAIAIAAALSTASMGGRAAELSDDDRAELRQRAQEFQNQRSANPDFQPGQGRAQPDDPTAKPAKRAGKSKRASSTKKETGRDKATKKARSVSKIPGAFVRR